MKNLYSFRFLMLLVLCSVCVFSTQAQFEDTREINVDTWNSSKVSSFRSGQSVNSKTVTCAPDTLGYCFTKSTVARLIVVESNVPEIAQFYDAPQELTIHGIRFYAVASSVVEVVATLHLYTAGPDSLPMGAPLASANVAVDSIFGGGALGNLTYVANFSTPITLTQDYVVVLENNSADTLSVVCSDYSTGDGQQEWLSSAKIGPTWFRSHNFSIGAFTFDADWMLEPIVSYDLEAGFVASTAPCIPANGMISVISSSSPIMNNRMYNRAVFFNVEEFSYTWDFGDGSPEQVAVIGNHTYTSQGQYDITLTDSLFGWTNICLDMITAPLISAPNTDFTATSTGLSASFTNLTDFYGIGGDNLWDFGDGDTSSISSPSHNYASAGSYTVCLFTTGLCGMDTICKTVDVVAGIREIKELGASIHPNPSNGKFSIVFDAPIKGYSVNIYSSIGSLVYSQGINDKAMNIDISDFNKGLYFIELTNEETQYVQKLMLD